MAFKENFPPSSAQGLGAASHALIPSPNKNPALIGQRDHSACRRPETPLKVRKTRENLRQSLYADIPPPCLHAHGSFAEHEGCIASDTTADGPGAADSHATAAPSLLYESLPEPPKPQRRKSVSRGMLSRVKQGITNKSKASYSARGTDTDSNALIRRLSGKRKQSQDVERRIQSYEATRESFESDRTPMPGSAQRSLTASSASTMDILGDYLSDDTPLSSGDGLEPGCAPDAPRIGSLGSSSPPSPSPEPTPRPLRREMRSALPSAPSVLAVETPCVSLRVSMDCSTIDVSSRRDVWVALEALVVVNSLAISSHAGTNGREAQFATDSNYCGTTEYSQMSYDCGKITSLRLCYKPTGNCHVREVVGQKTMKNVSVGQRCSLFIKVHVPEVPTRSYHSDSEQDSLFAELESIIGTLEVDILHVEARYRHSMLPTDNVVGIRRVCNVRRPDYSSRWSAQDLTDQSDDPSVVYRSLAEHLASLYSPSQTMALLQRYIGAGPVGEDGLCEIVSGSSTPMRKGSKQRKDRIGPSVTVNAMENVKETAATSANAFVTNVDSLQKHPGFDMSGCIFSTPSLAPPLTYTPKTAKALTPLTNRTRSSDFPHAHRDSTSTHQNSEHETEDSAREIWRKIRRTSLSARQLDALASPERLQQMEADDAGLRLLRRTAIANKRSVGAETLKGWKWEEEMEGGGGRDKAEAPWL